jgi:cobaltochelatase CobN
MHLLPVSAVSIDDRAEAVDLGQSPGEVVLLSFTDSDLTAAAAAWRAISAARPRLRLADMKRLGHPLSVDLYVEGVARHARAVIVRCLGGLDYWRYGLEELARVARERGTLFVALAGDDRPDPRLDVLSTAPPALVAHVDACFRLGGPANLARALRAVMGGAIEPPEPVPAAALGCCAALSPISSDSPAALVVGYRSHVMAADDAPIRALCGALAARGFRPVPVAVTSLKDPEAATVLAGVIEATGPAVVLNTTAFSGRGEEGSVLDRAGVPVLQAILAGREEASWAADPRGLGPADLAMNVVLPELDGRLGTRVAAFKTRGERDPDLEHALAGFAPHAEGVAALADLAASWARLGGTSRAERRIAIVLPDYPVRAGREAYAVGLDTFASAAAILRALAAAGYDVPEAPEASMLARRLVAERVLRVGKVVLALEPDRADPSERKARYHDPDLAPSDAYVAAMSALAREADALIPLGTHGVLEWLPGKAIAPSPACWPARMLGATPVIYPFIVSDPGEAAVAKRRLSAVTIGHLTPPLVEAGLHGESALIEGLLDEYAEAERLDPRRADRLAAAILDEARRIGLADEAKASAVADPRAALAAIDAFLCDVKALRVRDGLHVFGTSPAGADDLVAASGPAEMAALLAALDGRFVPPGPAGAPARGRRDVLPTGRNLTTTDPRALPTRTAVRLAELAAEEVLRRHLQDQGEHLSSIVVDLWASPTMRTGGEDLALALLLLGVRPRWDASSTRVSGVEAVSLPRLGRPRVDVTLRVSGLFRDVFPDQIALFDQAVRLVAGLDEPVEENPLALARQARRPLSRVFGALPGLYGTGTAARALDGDWDTAADLGATYLADTVALAGEAAPFAERVAGAQAFLHAADDADRDLLDADGVGDHVGGFAAAARSLGAAPALYHLDTTAPAHPKARTTAEEVARVLRGRVTNPRWLAGQMRHGRRGAAEMAQAVDAVFLFAATAGIVTDAQFDRLHDALLGDPEVAAFLARENPEAGMAIAARLDEARRRGLWRPRRNAVGEELAFHREAAE